MMSKSLYQTPLAPIPVRRAKVRAESSSLSGHCTEKFRPAQLQSSNTSVITFYVSTDENT